MELVKDKPVITVKELVSEHRLRFDMNFTISVKGCLELVPESEMDTLCRAKLEWIDKQLWEDLQQLVGIIHVMIDRKSLLVSKDVNYEWKDLRPGILTALYEAYECTWEPPTAWRQG